MGKKVLPINNGWQTKGFILQNPEVSSGLQRHCCIAYAAAAVSGDVKALESARGPQPVNQVAGLPQPVGRTYRSRKAHEKVYLSCEVFILILLSE